MADEDRTVEERRWCRAAAAGDRHAWQMLYDSAFDPLFAYVQWRCGGRRDWAEDIVQETWLIAVRKVGDFRPEQGTFVGWLRGIAAQLLRNHFRRVRRLPQPLVEAIQIQAGIVDVPEDPVERIAQTLARLPEHYEAVLRAKYLEQQTVESIAREGGQSTKAVESLLSRARSAFREIYETMQFAEEAREP